MKQPTADFALEHPKTPASRTDNGVGSGPLFGGLKKGDYVLATKYADGGPQDHWAIGFLDGITSPHYEPPRYNVVDSEGAQFRGNGFRRVEKISGERGAWMLKHARDIELSGMSVWHFATCSMDEPNTTMSQPGGQTHE